MKIAVITRSADIHSTQRLKEAAISRGHDVQILPLLQAGISLHEDRSETVTEGILLGRVDAVVPRITSYESALALALLRQLEFAGVFALNSSRAIENCIDKFRTLALLNRARIPTPWTALVKHPDRISWAIDQAGGAPVILKPLSGSRGERVILADTDEGARSAMEALLLLDQNVLVQEYIAESAGRDVRLLVVGKAVVGAVAREAPAGRFRSNLRQGGHGHPVRPSPELEDLALRASNALGLEVAGVDFLESARGSLVLEVNASPGLGSLEEATGLDVAGLLIRRIEVCSDARAPEGGE